LDGWMADEIAAGRLAPNFWHIIGFAADEVSRALRIRPMAPIRGIRSTRWSRGTMAVLRVRRSWRMPTDSYPRSGRGSRSPWPPELRDRLAATARSLTTLYGP
jgi:hypothetical protein